MIFMNSILYKPLSRIQQEREDLISKEREDAKNTKEKNEALKEQYRCNLEKSKALAKVTFNNKVSEYKTRKDAILESAKNLARKDLAIANAELEGDEREARLLLKPQVKELADAIATQVLGYETKIERE